MATDYSIMKSHVMPQPQFSKDIAPLIAYAKKLKSDLDDQINRGDDTESDRLARVYEESLDKCWKFKCETPGCLIKKLTFSQNLLGTDGSAAALVPQIFESIINDVKLIAKGS